MRQYIRNVWQAVWSILTGLALTMRYIGRRVATLQYPDEMVPLAGRYRGFHEYQIERCVGCGACVRACPAACIELKAEGKGKEAVLQRYAIDYSRCMFCALCVDVCPTACLHMGKVHDMSDYDRAAMVVDFAALARQGRRTPDTRWLAKARRAGKKAPRWAQLVENHYRAGEPICWGPVGTIDLKAKPPRSPSWADEQ